MTNMTDQGRGGVILGNILNFNNTTIVWPTGLHIRLMSTQGSNAPGLLGSGGSGTECTSGNSPGYTALGVAITFATVATVAATNSNAPQWTATGTWTAGVAAIELWDVAGTPLRWLQGALTVAIGTSVVTNADTVTFAIGAISASGAAW
jgi:hypothetical protein